MSYQKLNNLTGWVFFAISLFVYATTLEPTASFWDCGEFIAVARYLQTPHPPGAPIFSLMGRIFSLFSGTEPNADAAYWVNMMSAISGAFTVLFLFWSITMLARKLLKLKDEGSLADQIAVLGAGAVGALACTFSDSIWFSAVEAEVYAISLFFTAFVFWAMLKWETMADDPESDRWLILIAYMMGLSMGVHLLNLVTIPAMALIFYFKKFNKPAEEYGTEKKISFGGIFLTLVISAVVLFAILSALPGLSDLGFAMDRFFVNSLGLPFNVGAIFFATVVVGSLIYGILYAIKNQKRILHVSLMSTVFIFIGFLSYGVIIIRSNQDPVIDENDPEDLVNFISYLKREQYGDRPLLLGPQFNVSPDKYLDGKERWMKKDGKYVISTTDREYGYPEDKLSFLPRMYSTDPRHVSQYKSLIRNYNNGYPREYDRKGPDAVRISFSDNMSYLFDRQLGRMYWRYFLWNFVGRERQEQYASSLYPTDAPNQELPELIQHESRNNFYAIPLIIGLIGLLFQLYKDQDNFIVGALLFFFTGIAIIIYLNAPPIEPRERDYAYAGSYYTFTIWIGLAVIAFYELIGRAIKNKLGAVSLSLIVCLLAPGLMGAIGWDDHDRSKRYFSVDGAKNILNTCAKDAIIFTAGDNDTFPLWYVQEVEGFRNDVRVCNLSLLNTDWYIGQMTRKAHNSSPLPITFPEDLYRQGINDYLIYDQSFAGNVDKAAYQDGQYNYAKDAGYSLDKFLSQVRNKDRAVMQQQRGRDPQSYKIARKFIVPIDSSAVAKLELVPEAFKSKIPKNLIFDNTASTIYKKDLMMLDIINEVAKNGWERPVYFSTTAGAPGGENFQGIKEFLQHEGLAYRLVPFKANARMNKEITHKNLTENYFYRNLALPGVPYTDDYDRMVMGLKAQYLTLASEYLNDGQKDKAKEILDFYQSKISQENFPWKPYAPQYLDVVYKTYGNEVGDQEFAKLSKQNWDVVEYYVKSNDASDHRSAHLDMCLRNLISFTRILDSNGRKDRANHINEQIIKASKASRMIGDRVSNIVGQ